MEGNTKESETKQTATEAGYDKKTRKQRQTPGGGGIFRRSRQFSWRDISPSGGPLLGPKTSPKRAKTKGEGLLTPNLPKHLQKSL